MTPKEKAKELVDNFNYYNKHYLMPDAKQCALIAVNEIIDSYTHEIKGGYILSSQIIPYWQEVKRKIKKI